MTEARLFDINRCSFVDGPGIRTTFYFKGCSLRCRWCHNPESWKEDIQLLYYSDKCVHCGFCLDSCSRNALTDREKCIGCGKCAEACPHGARQLVGRDYSMDELVSEALRDRAFYGDDGGITCSGGECLLQVGFLREFLKEMKAEGIHTAVDTALNVPLRDVASAAEYTDLFLADVKCITPELHRRFTGADNSQILKNIRFLSDSGARIWIRIPVVKECSGTEDEMRKIADFVNSINAERVELLPYHTLGVNKARAAGYPGEKFDKVSPAETEAFSRMFGKGIVR